MTDNKIVEYKKEVSPIIKQAETLTVTNAEEVKEATEVLSRLNKSLDAIEAEKDKVLGPLKEAAKAEKARWKPLEDMFDGAVSRIRGLLSTYQTEQMRIKREEEAKVLARVGEGKGKFKVETVIRKLGEIVTPEARVEVESGGLTFRKSKTLKITDASKVPDEYWVIDEKKLLDALKDGKVVEGAEITVVQIPVNRR
jgi:hypothetical protein